MTDSLPCYRRAFQPPHKLTERARARRGLNYSNSDEFGHAAEPDRARLADQGRFLASESTFYRLLRDLCHREGIQSKQLILHSDNGNPMKGATVLATLQQLGVMPSLSRLAVSNDNPYSESLFKTLKYRPTYPLKAFANVTDARNWVIGLVKWYNHEHRHSTIPSPTP